MEKDVNENTGRWTCPKCQRELAELDNYCGGCGEKRPAPGPRMNEDGELWSAMRGLLLRAARADGCADPECISLDVLAHEAVARSRELLCPVAPIAQASDPCLGAEGMAGQLAGVWASSGSTRNPHPGEANQWRQVARWVLEKITPSSDQAGFERGLLDGRREAYALAQNQFESAFENHGVSWHASYREFSEWIADQQRDACGPANADPNEYRDRPSKPDGTALTSLYTLNVHPDRFEVQAAVDRDTAALRAEVEQLKASEAHWRAVASEKIASEASALRQRDSVQAEVERMKDKIVSLEIRLRDTVRAREELRADVEQLQKSSAETNDKLARAEGEVERLNSADDLKCHLLKDVSDERELSRSILAGEFGACPRVGDETCTAAIRILREQKAEIARLRGALREATTMRDMALRNADEADRSRSEMRADRDANAQAAGELAELREKLAELREKLNQMVKP